MSTPQTESTPLLSPTISKTTTTTTYVQRSSHNITVSQLKSPLLEDGEPNSEEIVTVIPKSTSSNEFSSRPVVIRKDSSTLSQSSSNLPINKSNDTQQTHRLPPRTSIKLRTSQIPPPNCTNTTISINHTNTVASLPPLVLENERTFVAWLHISILLGGTSLIILLISNDQNQYSSSYGLVLMPVSICFGIYSMVQYIRRGKWIRKQTVMGPFYEDILGLTFLTTMLMVSIVVLLSVKIYSLV